MNMGRFVYKMVSVREAEFELGDPEKSIGKYEYSAGITIKNGSLDEAALEWAITNGLIRAVKEGVFTYTTRYTIYGTDKFYFGYVLPEIVKQKPKNWMQILIKDSVYRNRNK